MLSAAELSVALRLEAATRGAVREALRVDGTLVKTYGPRGTVHLLPSADLPLWTGALSAIPAGADPMPPDVRMTEEQRARGAGGADGREGGGGAARLTVSGCASAA